MMAVIQCAGRKHPNAGSLQTRDGRTVHFVAHPHLAPITEGIVYARPDDVAENGKSWRQILVDYNSGNNPFGLCRAGQLYANPAYGRLLDTFGWDRVFILSAAWGLLAASFLTPKYDVTFSSLADTYVRRRKRDQFDDFSMIPAHVNEEIMFFGSKEYLPHFLRLSQNVRAPRTIFYRSSQTPEAPGCRLVFYDTPTKTNWHFECVNAVLDNRISW